MLVIDVIFDKVWQNFSDVLFITKINNPIQYISNIIMKFTITV